MPGARDSIRVYAKLRDRSADPSRMGRRPGPLRPDAPTVTSWRRYFCRPVFQKNGHGIAT